MAQIDPNIALSVRPLQLESPVNQMTAIAQLQGLQQQQQLNQLKMQEAQRADTERNALLQTISGEGFDLNNPAHVQNLLRKAPTLGMPYVKEARMAAAEKARADKEAVQAQHEQFKMRREQLDFTEKALQNSPNPALARSHIQQAIDLKYVSPEVGTQMLTSVPEDPTEFEAWRANLISQSMSAKDRLERTAPKPEKIEQNGQIMFIDMNPNSPTYGKPTGLEEAIINKQPKWTARDIGGSIVYVDENPRSDTFGKQKEGTAITKTVAPSATEGKTEAQRNYEAATDGGFTGTFAEFLDQQKETADEREWRKAVKNGTFKGTFVQWKQALRPVSHTTVQAPTLSKDALDMAADRFLPDGTLPPGINKANRDAIMNRAATVAKDKGINPDRVAQLEVTANKQALGQLSKTETMVGAFEKNFVKNVKIVENLNAKKDSTGVPLLQRWINAGKKAVSGDPDLAALNIAIKAVQNEYGKIVSGSMGNTAVAVSEIKRMEDLLNSAQTPQDVQAVLNTMKAETQNRMAGFKEQRAELTQSMRSSTTAPATKSNAPAPYTDAEKERRYQEWKAKQGGR